MYPINDNPICTRMMSLDITGNVVPKRWYHTIVKPDRKRPGPYHLAIDILAEVVFRYRPMPAADGLGWEKSFQEDLLQLSYADLADRFNASAVSVKDAVCFLEELGVIRRVLRTVKRGGRRLPNVLYLELNVDRLRELTEIPGDAVPPVPAEFSPLPGKISPHAGVENTPIPGEIPPHTRVENTPTNTKKDFKTVLYTSGRLAEDPGGRVSALALPPEEETVTALVFQTRAELTALLRRATHYDWYMATGYLAGACEEEKDRWREVYRTVVGTMADLCCFKGTRRFSLGTRTAGEVLAVFERLLPREEGDGLAALAEAVTNTYLAEADPGSIRCPAAYLASMLLAFAERPEDHGLFGDGSS